MSKKISPSKLIVGGKYYDINPKHNDAITLEVVSIAKHLYTIYMKTDSPHLYQEVDGLIPFPIDGSPFYTIDSKAI